MNRADIPDEEEHFQNYSKIIRALKGAPLTVRTVDLGADKQSEQTEKGPLTRNPALGLRGIRRCLKEPALVRTATAGHPACLAQGTGQHPDPDADQSRRGAADAPADRVDPPIADRRGHKVGENLRVGGMIEVPAAAIAAELFARDLDFLSIGTNDLIQYTLAIDRIDDHVNYLYDPLHPAVLLLIQQVIAAGKKRRVPVSMCGEMAGDPRFVRC